MRALVAGFVVLQIATIASAIIVIRDPGRNLCAPTGALADSGWQYEGEWRGFTGTAIGPHNFITAVHVGGFTGAPFYYRGHTYRAKDATVISGTDICVWSIFGTFPAWATVYQGNSEVAHDIMLFGRGTARGKPIVSFGTLRGWTWGATDHRLSWGKSWISATAGHDPNHREVPILGDTLIAPFDVNVGPDAGMPSGGDSGGGVFLKDDDGKWKLAGVIYGGEVGYLPTATSRAPASAALYDGRGLYHLLPNGKRGLLATYSTDQLPGQTIVSRISSSLPEIRKAMTSTEHVRYVATYLAFIVLLPALGVLAGLILAVRHRVFLNPALADALPASAAGTTP